MTRVALVTGGTRGIDAAISQALQAADYTVAATSAGNAEAAKGSQAVQAFRSQWDAVIRTNLDGLFNKCRQIIDGMRTRKRSTAVSI